MKQFFLTFLLALLVSQPIKAETIYVSQSGSGTGTGADTSNRMSVSGFNTAGNWDTDVANDGKIGPGDTVSLSGTLTSQLVIQGSGTSGNQITILFESGAKLSAAFWSSDGALKAAGKSYITVDGGNTGTVGARKTVEESSWSANVEATDAGEGLGNTGTNYRGIYFDGSSVSCVGIILRNLCVKNIYKKIANSTDYVDSGNNIVVEGNDILISNCYTENGNTGIYVKSTVTNGDNIIVEDCSVLNMSNGIKYATRSSGNSINGTNNWVRRNRVDGMSTWGGGIGNDHHHNDGIQTITQGSPGIHGLRVAYNWVGPSFGTNLHSTAGIYMENYVEQCLVYNNVIQYGTGESSANSAITVVETDGWTSGEGLVANNTILGGGTGLGISIYHYNAFNNVIYNIGNLLTVTASGNSGLSDSNVLWGISTDTDGQYYNGAVTYSRFAGSLPNWSVSSGNDANSINQNPLLNSDGTLQSGSPARGFGMNLSSIFTDDFNGNTRSDWDAGAFEYSGSPPGGSSGRAFSSQIGGRSVTFGGKVELR